MSKPYPNTEAEKELVRAAAVDLYRALKAVYDIIDADDDLNNRFIDCHFEVLEQVELALCAAVGESVDVIKAPPRK